MHVETEGGQEFDFQNYFFRPIICHRGATGSAVEDISALCDVTNGRVPDFSRAELAKEVKGGLGLTSGQFTERLDWKHRPLLGNTGTGRYL